MIKFYSNKLVRFLIFFSLPIVVQMVAPMIFDANYQQPMRIQDQLHIKLVIVIYLSLYSLIIYLISYNLYKFIGKKILFIPLTIAMLVLFVNIGIPVSGDYTMIFYGIQIPLLVGTTIYCFGFVIGDVIEHIKSEMGDR